MNTAHQEKSHKIYRVLLVIFVLIILVGFGILLATRYVYQESQNPDSLIGQAWLDIRSEPDSDLDQDGLSNEEEDLFHSDAWVADTDGDGFNDGEEVSNGYNPTGGGRIDDPVLKVDLDDLTNFDVSF